MKDKIEAEINMYDNLIQSIDKDIEELTQNKLALYEHINILENTLSNLKNAPCIAKPLRTFIKIRKDARASKIIKFIKQMERPVSLDEVCNFIWPEGFDDKQRDSLRGNISQYILDRQVFVRVAPAVYGLLELGHKEEKENGI